MNSRRALDELVGSLVVGSLDELTHLLFILSLFFVNFHFPLHWS